MVVLDLIIEFNCENIEKVFVERDFEWNFIVKCSSCNEEHPNVISFQEGDEVEGSKGSTSLVNFALKCKNCSREGFISFLKDSKREVVSKNSKAKGSLACFDCRGIDIVQWMPKDGISAIAEESGTVFENVDFSDIWVEYDEKTQNNCQIEDFKQKFERRK